MNPENESVLTPVQREVIAYLATRPQNLSLSPRVRRVMFVVPIQLLFRNQLNCTVQAQDIADALKAYYEPEEDFITAYTAAWVMREVFQDANHVISGAFMALKTSEGYQFCYNRDCLEDIHAIVHRHEPLRTAA